MDLGRTLLARLALAAAVLVATIVLADNRSAAQGTLDERIHQKRVEIDAARKRLEAKRRELRFQEIRKEDLERQLADTNRSIDGVSASLAYLGSQVRENERRLAWNELQLRAAKATLQRHTDALRRRLVDIYERGDLGYLNVLLSANTFSDFVERWNDIRYLVAANEQTVRERRAAEKAVSLAQQKLETERAALEELVRRQEEERYKLAALANQRSQLAAVAAANQRSVAHEVGELEDLTSAQESTLEELIRQLQLQNARAGKIAGQEGNGGAGGLSWPVSGPITSPFGMRANPLGGGFEMHPGIDIGAPMGATITAAASGTVIYSGWYGGYGNAIIIDHGSGTSTLYGHCSQIFVANGQSVQRGQAIGAVGMTGRATGPHLHFEVRVNGTPVDPTGRLR